MIDLGHVDLDDLQPTGEVAERAGATRKEAAEAIGVSLLMGDGRSTIYGPRAYATFCEFPENCSILEG